MAYAILRTYKHTTNGTLSSMGLHNQRSIHTPNADPARTPENKELIGTGDYLADVNARLDSVAKEQEEKGSSLLIQKNSVKAIEHLMTASPEYFQGIDREKKIKGFIKACGRFLENTYGRENIVSASLHLDEKTPHLTVIVTPITEGKLKSGKEIKRLGAKKWLDGRAKMMLLQDKFAEECKHLGLERGKRNSRAKHTTIKEFYNLMNEVEDNRKINHPTPKIPTPPIIGREAWKEKVNIELANSFEQLKGEVQKKLDLRLFRDAKEKLQEKKHKEDAEEKKMLKNALNELKNKITNKEGDNLKLKMQLKETYNKADTTKEVLKNVLEGRYSPEEMKKIANQVGARLIDKNRGLDI